LNKVGRTQIRWEVGKARGRASISFPGMLPQIMRANAALICFALPSAKKDRLRAKFAQEIARTGYFLDITVR
jgi:hypothetical protein